MPNPVRYDPKTDTNYLHYAEIVVYVDPAGNVVGASRTEGKTVASSVQGPIDNFSNLFTGERRVERLRRETQNAQVVDLIKQSERLTAEEKSILLLQTQRDAFLVRAVRYETLTEKEIKYLALATPAKGDPSQKISYPPIIYFIDP